MSAQEAVAALRRLGFCAQNDEGRMVLVRGHRRVVVPTDKILEADTVREILRDSGVDYLSLLDNLETPLPIANDAGDGNF
jgi:predicted RNA binding protein YcfA (HicA-like mRNA interferase family)